MVRITSIHKEYQTLAYSPVGMGLDKETGWGTLLFSASRACTRSCYGCWTNQVGSLIRQQLASGSQWLYDGRYELDVLSSLLSSFKDNGGRLVALMNDGETLDRRNYDFVLKLAEHVGDIDLPLLLFTFGGELNNEKIQELGKAAKGKVSYSISIQTGDLDRYGYQMITMLDGDPERQKRIGRKTMEEEVYGNFNDWREHDAEVLEKTGKHGIGIHTYVNDRTTREDLESLEEIAKKLGNVPQTITSWGVHVKDTLIGRQAKLQNSGLLEEFKTGPTADLIFGDKEGDIICSYIAHGHYSFSREKKGVFGITFHPYERGQLQTCPYHRDIGTREWLALRDYLDVMKENEQQITDEHIGRWLENAVKAETMITTAAFDLTGYEHCLMRHSRKPEIDLFISGVNNEMAKRRRDGKLDVKDKEYFDNVIAELNETIKGILNQNG